MPCDLIVSHLFAFSRGISAERDTPLSEAQPGIIPTQITLHLLAPRRNEGPEPVVVVDAGETGFLIGGDLDLPPWFAPDFYIPDDLSITQVSNDGQRMTPFGEYEVGDPATLQQEMIDNLEANGYEFLTDSGGLAVFIRDGLGRVRLKVTDQETPEGLRPALDVDIDLWTDEQIAELRALFEP